MKKSKMIALAVTIVVILVTSTVVFADQALTSTANTFTKHFRGNSVPSTPVDPTKMLEKEKANIQKKLTDGKITQDAADKAIAQIDQKIKAMQDFNLLTTQQKKDKLSSDYTAAVSKKVTDGKLTQEKADKAIADYKTKLDKWDGTGYPFFRGNEQMGRKEFKGPGKNMQGGKMPNKFTDALDKAVKDGKITQQQQNDILSYIKE